MVKRYKLDNIQHSTLRLISSACTAFPTCGLAMAESERYSPVLITMLEKYVEENGLSQDNIVTRMTGHPNGCARMRFDEVAFEEKANGFIRRALEADTTEPAQQALSVERTGGG